MTCAVGYTRFELRRTLRNWRLLIFSLGFPLLLFLAIAGPNRGVDDFGGTGISLPLYYMVGLVAFGAMMALISSGARIATERTEGWTRQLRITPLPAGAYLRAKVITGYAMAALTMATLYATGVALGVFIGHLLTADTIGPAAGGLVSLLALVSGTWFPVGDGIIGDIAQGLPSYWLVQASHVSLGGGGWGITGWIVVTAWSLVLGVLAMAVHRRDTERI